MKANRIIVSVVVFVLMVSCDFILPVKKDKIKEPILASVGEVNLYESELKNIVPNNMDEKDSVFIIKSFINSWAKHQLLLQKAEETISEINSNEISDLVNKYKESLYINKYKERLIKQQLDTVVSNQEVFSYFEKHKDNFKLNEELLQIKFIYFGNDFLDKKEAIQKFKSDKEEDLQDLENLTINFKDYYLRDSTWITYDKVLTKIPPFRGLPKNKLLKKTKFIQKEDSLGVYLVAVNDVLKRNDIAPLSYIKENIKQLILHKRKIELIREIEKTLIDDAIKNNIFKEH